MSVYYRAAGDPPGDWQEIGHTSFSDISFGSDPEEEPLGYGYKTMPLQGWTETFEFTITNVSQRMAELLSGSPFHPVKHQGLTGKAYRQACRAHQRRLKAFSRGEVGWRDVR